LSSLPLAETVSDVLESFRSIAKEKGVNLCTGDGLAHEVVADRDKLQQILTNLVHNAIKFTPRGGDICIDAEPAGGSIRVAVTDTGCGVPPDEIEKVFDKFYRGDSVAPETRGAGLGLAITKTLVELHGGRIWAESRLQHGSRFCFTIPRTHHSDYRIR
jgi:signal transduction histidine kinase